LPQVRERYTSHILITALQLAYRTIDPERDRELLLANYRDAYTASFAVDDPPIGRVEDYLPWLRARVLEFPEGHVLAMLPDSGQVVGQLELQVPYGLDWGYVNLYAVLPAFRRRGIGRRMHAYAEQYFRRWDARRIELHVSPKNEAALNFYRAMGYRFERAEGKVWRLVKSLE
jgi:ribosomal protein S18 acetylase RimI-like enzyme